jgi:hypothetical protein
MCLLLLGLPAGAATGHVIKVLPEYLDLKGHNSLSPSLYERDAYQVYLRDHPEKRSALRFYTEWKVKGPTTAPLKLRVELRGTATGNLPKRLILEAPVEPKGGWFGHWSSLTLAGADFKEFGQVTAWRVSFWEGNQLLGEQKSFLW